MLLASRWAIFSATTAGIIAYSPSGLLSTARRAIARRPLIRLGLGGLVDHDFFDQIIIGEVKADIAPGDRNAVHLDQLLHLGFILFRQHRLLLLLAELLIALQLSFLFSSTASRASRA